MDMEIYHLVWLKYKKSQGSYLDTQRESLQSKNGTQSDT